MQSRPVFAKAFIATLCCIAAILLTTSLAAQTFQQSQFTSAGANIFGIKAADVNNDGKLDLIVISDPNSPSAACAGNANGDSSYDLVVHLGKGDGTFGPPVVLHSGICWGELPSVSEFEVVDVNRDGKPDLVYAGGDKLGIMLGNGDGTFQAPQLHQATTQGPVNDFVNSLTTGDFTDDGDNMVDFVVSTNQYIETFYRNFDLSVQPVRLFSAPPNAFGVEAGDFDNDGALDIAFWTQSDQGVVQLHVWFGDANGNFPDQRVVDSPTTSFFTNLKVKDINGDGFADIIATTSSSAGQGVVTYLGNAGRTFSKKSASSPYGGAGPSWGDFNADGTLDLVTSANCGSVAGCSGSKVLIWPRTADGSILSPTQFNVAAAPNGLGDVIAADFNGDGKPDIAVIAHFNQIDVMMNQGAGCLPATLYSLRLCSPANGSTYSSPVPISATANSDSPVVAWKVYVDGVSKATGGSGSSFQASVAMATGPHRVTVKAWDSTGRVISGMVNITVAGSASGGGGGACSAGALFTVQMCSPQNGGTYSSPVPVSATANSDHSITGWKLYVDGLAKASTGSMKSWSTSVAMSSGSHRVTAKAWDSTGRAMSATATITVH